jgi:hypothetical protein
MKSRSSEINDWFLGFQGDEEEQNKFFTTGVFVQVLMKLITVEVWNSTPFRLHNIQLHP